MILKTVASELLEELLTLKKETEREREREREGGKNMNNETF